MGPAAGSTGPAASPDEASPRVGYFGPAGTFTEEALHAAWQGRRPSLHPYPTVFDAVTAVQEGEVELALVPIENSLEGAVNATLDALALEVEDVLIVGEVVHPISHCLIARADLDPAQAEAVVSHPQVLGQCARFIRTHLGQAQLVPSSSSAEAVRLVAESDHTWVALGNRLAAELYGLTVLQAGVEDVAGNETRFVWLARGPQTSPGASAGGRWKTAIVFAGERSDTPGWLVACLSEFARREVNLTRIESRPRKQGLGRYMFFVDLEGRVDEPTVAAALEGLRGHVESLRVLGSFPAAG